MGNFDFLFVNFFEFSKFYVFARIFEKFWYFSKNFEILVLFKNFAIYGPTNGRLLRIYGEFYGILGNF